MKLRVVFIFERSDTQDATFLWIENHFPSRIAYFRDLSINVWHR